MILTELELSKISGGTKTNILNNLFKLYRLFKIKLLVKKLFID